VTKGDLGFHAHGQPLVGREALAVEKLVRAGRGAAAAAGGGSPAAAAGPGAAATPAVSTAIVIAAIQVIFAADRMPRASASPGPIASAWETAQLRDCHGPADVIRATMTRTLAILARRLRLLCVAS
jgi:hypothetical protein